VDPGAERQRLEHHADAEHCERPDRDSISCGLMSFSTPSKIANTPPRLKSTNATTKAQKYRAVP